MILGYAVEGSTHRAFVNGIARRWCPEAELVEGPFRGSTGLSLRREIRKIVEAFILKGVNVAVIITDANGRPWREVKMENSNKLSPERRNVTITAIPDRNIESWICADPRYVGEKLNVDAGQFDVPDPKHAFERAAGVSRDDKKEELIAELVEHAPLANWLRNESFEEFYENARDLSQQLGCNIENLRTADRR